jgi:hypothetical protein
MELFASIECYLCHVGDKRKMSDVLMGLKGFWRKEFGVAKRSTLEAL